MVVYTHATWNVKPGHEAAFEQAWKGLGKVFGRLARVPVGEGTLLRRADAPQQYVSFGPWPDAEAVAAMRADPDAQAGIQAVLNHCIDGDPGMYEVAAIARA